MEKNKNIVVQVAGAEEAGDGTTKKAHALVGHETWGSLGGSKWSMSKP